MSKYTIHLRGKEQEKIKVVSRIPGKNGNKGFQLHFPCLSVHVLDPNDDHDTEYYCITWSNYHERSLKVDGKVIKDYELLPHNQGGPQRTPNPGTFKIKRVQMKPEMIVVTDNGNGRKMSYSRATFPGGKPMLNYTEMAFRWGTTFDLLNGWDYGKDHPMERTDEELVDCASVDSIERELEQRFGDFGETILELFVTHELFLKYLTVSQPQLIAA